MTDQELLQAIGQVVEAKMEPMRQDICAIKDDVRVLQVNYTKLEKQVGVLEVKVDGLSEKVGSLDKKVDNLEEKTDSLDKKIGCLEEKVSSLEEKVTSIRIYIDTDLNRALNLLLEGQKAAWDRATPPERYNALEIRTSALEVAVKQHSHDIQELMLA